MIMLNCLRKTTHSNVYKNVFILQWVVTRMYIGAIIKHGFVIYKTISIERKEDMGVYLLT